MSREHDTDIVIGIVSRILEHKRISQVLLAEEVGVHQSAVSYWRAGKRVPDTIQCLAMYGMAHDEQDRKDLLRLSGLSDKMIKLLAKSLGSTSANVLTPEKDKLCSWYDDPREEIDVHLREVSG